MTRPAERVAAAGAWAGAPARPTGPPPSPSDPSQDRALDAPLRVRSTPLLVIAVLMSLAALRLASEIFIPLVLGVMLSYALTPLVQFLVRLHLPRFLAAAVLLLGIVGGAGSVVYSLSDDLIALIETLPQVTKQLRDGLAVRDRNGPSGTIEKVQRVASELERSADAGIVELEPERDVSKVQIEQPKFNIKKWLLPGSLSMAAAAAKLAIVFFLAFFLLVAGDDFRRKMVKLAGPSLSEKKLTLHALDRIDDQIQRYLLVQIFTSAAVGLATWLTFLCLGVDNAAVWGLITFTLNFIPYLGSIVATLGATLVGFSQFGSFEMALLIGGSVLLINVLEGYGLTPWLTSRATRMNPVAVFSGVLAWGWLWGIWGLFLGVPILMVIKVICDRMKAFRAVGELLGE